MVIVWPAWAMLKWRRDPQSLIGPAVLLAYPVLAGVAVGSTLFIGRFVVLLRATAAWLAGITGMSSGSGPAGTISLRTCRRCRGAPRRSASWQA